MSAAARTVLCFGDSNTHGTCPMRDLDDRRRFARDVRWPGVMAAALGPAWHVIEEGHPGRTTVHPDPVEGAHKNGRAVLPALLESHRPVDAVVLMLGTNDLKTRFAATPLDIALATAALARMIAASEAGPAGGAPAVLVVAPPPIREVGRLGGMFAGGAAKSAGLAPACAEAAAEAGAAFLDAGALVAVADDGIHLDAGAHAALGRGIADAVAALPQQGED